MNPTLHSGAVRAGWPPAGRWGQWIRRWLLPALLLLAIAPRVPAAEDPALEYKVKAGFLFNFAKFVEWPSKAFDATNSPIVIGIRADDPAAPVLQLALQGKVANGRSLAVKLLPDTAGLSSCHIFFLGRTQKERFEDMLARAQGLPVLTVGEMDEFAHRGGMVNFVRKDEAFRFDVNLDAAEKVGLKVSGKLASMATIVKPRK